MQKDSLASVLKDASGTPDRDGTYVFDASRGLAFLVASGGTMLSIDRVRRVSLKKGYVSVESERGERYFVEAESVVALRLHDGDEKSGFVHPKSQ